MLQEDCYKKLVGPSHLRRYGQYFTPDSLARLMARWVDQIQPAKVLDPAVGSHVFARSLLEIGSSARVVGFEIDPVIASEFSCPVNTDLILQDFLLSSWQERYDGIIANPPYMKFQLIENREAIREHFTKNYDNAPNWQSNIYLLFLLKAVSQLRTGGRMIFLVPHDFLDSKSGNLLKSELIRTQCLEGIVSLEHFDGHIFPDVLTSSSLLKISKRSNVSVRFSRPENSSELENAVLNDSVGKKVPYEDLVVQAKWRKYFTDCDRASSDWRLGDFVEVKRGIATGANAFFILSPSEARLLNIDDSELCNILSRSSLVKGAVFTESQMARLIDSDSRCKLFSPGLHLSTGAQAYVVEGEKAGWQTKYLCAARREWFRSEIREPAPIWVSQASRGNIRVVRNRSKALNLTTFHGVWPSEMLGLTADSVFAVLLSEGGQKALLKSAKRMANGLLKIQPGDLKGADFPDLLQDSAALRELDRLGALLGSELQNHRQELKEIDNIVSQLL